ncbi:hypothetical protein AMTR_s00193p00029480 [Amborella trichopoda]|uniref:Non-haem dioxygenase N-terminal domain-containing protein n=1 Tax=Amborella trichopoda TaxID=13333 RepID=U5DDB0_AMBTC|nr:hypothetical protein AMTR_s00193p00029480 [Amborella trichopoda]
MNQETEQQDKMAPSIDPSRIQPVETRPSIGSIKYLENVPIIDLAPLQLPHNSSTDEAKASIAKQVHNAFKEWGFFVAINHGVSPDLWSNLKMAMAGFSALPYEEKKKAARYVKNPWGFSMMKTSPRISQIGVKFLTIWQKETSSRYRRTRMQIARRPGL